MDYYLTLISIPPGIPQHLIQALDSSGESRGRKLCNSSLVSHGNADHTPTDQAVFELRSLLHYICRPAAADRIEISRI